MNRHSPTLWTIRPHLPDAHFEVVADAEGNTVGTATRPADAALIVEAVNAVEATRKLQRTLLGWSMEGDRLRDLVRRFADGVRNYRFAAGPETNALLREAREALGEAAP